MAPNMLKKLLLNTVVTQYFLLISLALQPQQIVQTYFTHQRRIIDAILAISLRKKNHFVRKLGMRRLKRLQRRPRSFWYKDAILKATLVSFGIRIRTTGKGIPAFESS